MQTPEATNVAIIAAALSMTTCYALACLTAARISKAALDNSHSADRAKILNEVGAILRHLSVFRWRRK